MTYNDEMSKIVWRPDMSMEEIKAAAKQKRDELIKKYPQLQKTQDEYDRIMSKTREEDKIQVAFMLLGAKVEELNKAIDKLKEAKNE